MCKGCDFMHPNFLSATNNFMMGKTQLFCDIAIQVWLPVLQNVGLLHYRTDILVPVPKYINYLYRYIWNFFHKIIHECQNTTGIYEYVGFYDLWIRR